MFLWFNKIIKKKYLSKNNKIKPEIIQIKLRSERSLSNYYEFDDIQD